MEEVIHYLELKNQYYEKLHSMTVKFLGLAQQNRWEGLELFVDNRDRVLNMIRSYDFRIAGLFDGMDLTSPDLDVYKDRVKALLDARADWAGRTVKLDLDLISRMEEIKADTIRELKKAMET